MNELPSVSIENLCGCAWEVQTPVLLNDATEATVDVRCPVHDRFGLRLRIRLPGAINAELLEACKWARELISNVCIADGKISPSAAEIEELCRKAIAKAEGK